MAATWLIFLANTVLLMNAVASAVLANVRVSKPCKACEAFSIKILLTKASSISLRRSLYEFHLLDMGSPFNCPKAHCPASMVKQPKILETGSTDTYLVKNTLHLAVKSYG